MKNTSFFLLSCLFVNTHIFAVIQNNGSNSNSHANNVEKSAEQSILPNRFIIMNLDTKNKFRDVDNTNHQEISDYDIETDDESETDGEDITIEIRNTPPFTTTNENPKKRKYSGDSDKANKKEKLDDESKFQLKEIHYQDYDIPMELLYPAISISEVIKSEDKPKREIFKDRKGVTPQGFMNIVENVIEDNAEILQDLLANRETWRVDKNGKNRTTCNKKRDPRWHDLLNAVYAQWDPENKKRISGIRSQIRTLQKKQSIASNTDDSMRYILEMLEKCVKQKENNIHKK